MTMNKESQTETAPPPNMGPIERIVSLAAGASLVHYGAPRRGVGGALSTALGAVFALRSIEGRCPGYESLDGRARVERPYIPRGWLGAAASVLIEQDAAALYRQWRDMEQLP